MRLKIRRSVVCGLGRGVATLDEKLYFSNQVYKIQLILRRNAGRNPAMDYHPIQRGSSNTPTCFVLRKTG